MSAFRSIRELIAAGDFRGSWLARNSFVDEELRLFYVPTLKVACTAVKHLLRRLKTDEPVGFVPTAPEVSREMFIHDNSQMPYRNLLDYSPSAVLEMLRAPGWFRFGVVRDPVSRFFSAWRDNVFLCRPGNERFLEGDRRHVEFTHFAGLVLAEDDPLTCDAHWRAQWAVLRPEEIDYTRVYRIEEIAELQGDLARHLAAVGAGRPVPPLPRINEGFDLPSAGFLDVAVVERLHGFYERDYAAFGFAKRPGSHAPATPAAAFTSRLTDAIFERNRVIAAHVYVAQMTETQDTQARSN